MDVYDDVTEAMNIIDEFGSGSPGLQKQFIDAASDGIVSAKRSLKGEVIIKTRGGETYTVHVTGRMKG